MKRAKHFLTHKRHWLWYGLSGASTIAGALSQIVSPESHPVGFVAISVLSGIAGLVAHACAPADDGN